MSSSGFPDWQRITQWFAAPIDEGAGVSLDAGDHVSGPFDLLSFASVVVCVKATGGPVVVTVTQTVPGGPASLQVSSSFTVATDNVEFEPVVLDAGIVTITFHEQGAGTSIDYAIVPSNVNSNVAGSLLAQLGFQHNDTPVANETALDLEDSGSVAWLLVDDAANARVKATATASSLMTRTQLTHGATSFTPPAGTTRHHGKVWGGGGGGSACAASGATTQLSVGSPGGSGGCTLFWENFTGTCTCAIGAGGAGGVAGGFNAGVVGGDSTITANTVARKGGGGGAIANGLAGGTAVSYAGGAGGGNCGGATGDVFISGSTGFSSRSSGSVGRAECPPAPLFGVTASQVVIAASAGGAGINGPSWGSGGGPGIDTANVSRVGGFGGDGTILVESFA